MRSLVRAILNLFFNIKVVGKEKLLFNGPSIVMPNHTSFLDAILMYAYLPANACFVVNSGIATKIGFALRWIDHIIVDPLNPYSLKKIVAAVKIGSPVVLFPEGRITTTGSLMKIYSGIGLISLRTGATLYPVILLGPELSKYSRMEKKLRTRWFPPLVIHVGSPTHLEVNQSVGFRQQKKEISDRILNLLQQTMFQAKQARETRTNLFDKLLDAARLHGRKKIMAEDISGTVTYANAIIGSYVLGAKFRRLLIAEDTVGVMLPNSIGHLVTLFALFAIGKTPAVLNFSTGAENNLNCAETAGIKTVLTSRAFIEKGRLDDLAARLAAKLRIVYLEDIKAQVTWSDKVSAFIKYLRQEMAANSASTVEPSLILFTSGSESKPKGVVLYHRHLMANLNQISCIVDYTHQDKMLNALPMFHSFGLLAGTLLPVFSGMDLFLYPSPLHYKIVPELAYDRNATVLLSTPSFLHGYAKYCHPYDFYKMRYVLAGGEKLKDEVRHLWSEKFGLRIMEGYGTTETAPVLSLNTPLFFRVGTVGRFLPGIEWRLEAVPGIEEGGNLFVKGPNVMAGYLLHGKGFVPAEEWYDCGDVVAVDDEGFVSIKSRLKRFAKISGEMISLDSVEKTAEKCFGTDRNAAVNMPDSKKGEKIILYTMYKTATKQALRDFVSQSGQSMLFLPTDIIIVEKLPLLGSGKTDYVSLKAMAQKEVESA
ncbi:MAG TPA: AMP-binding protein [Negativicutes bacterium]|nr:AMP-binding protein [Negativicutes bacterium]